MESSEEERSIKNKNLDWGRVQFILRVLAKYGFTSLIKEIGLKTFSSGESSTENPAIRLRKALEELGPTFIKFGQILSTRPDLLPQNYIDEFEKLTDRIPAFPFQTVLEILETELTRDPYEIFESIEESAIAAASISQVHRATLKQGENRDVVIKVQRPEIAKDIESDIQILFFLASSLEKVRKDFRLFNLTGMVREFQKSIYEELDFSLESKNIEEIAQSVPSRESIVLPQVIWPFSTRRVLTMTEIKGRNLSQMKSFPENIDRAFLAEEISQFFLESIFFHGLFHCDAHAGNLMILSEGRGQVGLVDFGMVGRLSPALRDQLGKIFLALVRSDFKNLATLYAEVARFGKSFAIKDFQEDLRKLLEPNLNRPLGEVDVGEMMLQSIQLARKYQIQLPRDLILFYRAAVTLEHVGRTIDPEFRFLNVGTKFAKQMIQQRMSSENMLQEVLKITEGLRSLGTDIPSQLKSILYKIDSDQFFPQFDRFADGIRVFKKSNQLLSLSLALFGVFLASSILTAFQPEHFLIPILWSITGLFLVLFFKFLFRR